MHIELRIEPATQRDEEDIYFKENNDMVAVIKAMLTAGTSCVFFFIYSPLSSLQKIFMSMYKYDESQLSLRCPNIHCYYKNNDNNNNNIDDGNAKNSSTCSLNFQYDVDDHLKWYW